MKISCWKGAVRELQAWGHLRGAVEPMKQPLLKKQQVRQVEPTSCLPFVNLRLATVDENFIETYTHRSRKENDQQMGFISK